jgi:hypothetical protein
LNGLKAINQPCALSAAGASRLKSIFLAPLVIGDLAEFLFPWQQQQTGVAARCCIGGLTQQMCIKQVAVALPQRRVNAAIR